MTIHLGMRPYYRRTLKGGAVVIYLRSATEKARIVVEAAASIGLMPAGKSYTIEMTTGAK